MGFWGNVCVKGVSHKNSLLATWVNLCVNYHIYSFCVTRSNDKYKPPDHRSLALLAYLSGSLSGMPGSRSLNAVTPVEVPWSSVAIHVCDPSIPDYQLLYALNAAIVALCQVPSEEVNIIPFECFQLSLLLLVRCFMTDVYDWLINWARSSSTCMIG